MMRSLIVVLVLLSLATCHACDTYSTGPSSSYADFPLRSNITEQQQGAPLTLVITLVNRTVCQQQNGTDLSTGLLTGVEVDVWHVNAAGAYSTSTINSTWLRGYQITNSTGMVVFQTIYPGYEKGRTVHVNVHVEVPIMGAIETDDTQIFFDDAVSNAIYASFPSYSYGTRSIYNNNDTYYSNNMVSYVLGDSVHGYTAYVDLFYPFVTMDINMTNNATTTDTNISTSSNTTTNIPTQAPTNATTTNVTTDMPTNTPTAMPTNKPTDMPTDFPTAAPTNVTSNNNVTTTDAPTGISPTDKPTSAVTTDAPTNSPNATITTNAPTTITPTTMTPTLAPNVTVTDAPTMKPNITFNDNTTTTPPTTSPTATVGNTANMWHMSSMTMGLCSLIVMTLW